MTVLHVEQEVTGDDTVVLESLLECDVERAQLLKREQQLLGNTERSPTSPVPLSDQTDHSELSKVWSTYRLICVVNSICYSINRASPKIYQRLHEIDADQAPAR